MNKLYFSNSYWQFVSGTHPILEIAGSRKRTKIHKNSKIPASTKIDKQKLRIRYYDLTFTDTLYKV